MINVMRVFQHNLWLGNTHAIQDGHDLESQAHDIICELDSIADSYNCFLQEADFITHEGFRLI